MTKGERRWDCPSSFVFELSRDYLMDHRLMSRRARLIALGAILCLDLLCVGLATAILTLFTKNFPLLGLVLIGQAFFLMMLILAATRLVPLDADHQAFQDGRSPAAVIARMEQTRTRLLMAELVSGAITLLVGIIFAVVSTLRWQPLFLAATIIMVPLGFALIGHSFTLRHRRSAYEYARLAGTRASARVLKVTNTGWSIRSRSFDSARIYMLDIEVMPPSGAPYHITLRQPIRKHPSIMPQVGATIPVKYLPDQPDVVVALLDPEDRAPDVQ
jgi:uncharacterized membrane protein